MKHNVPVQSLIDHIKTATDVDPWAKEMVEELIREPVKPQYKDAGIFCGGCDSYVRTCDLFCASCGRKIDWGKRV
jgi:hypothetical protein